MLDYNFPQILSQQTSHDQIFDFDYCKDHDDSLNNNEVSIHDCL